MKIVFLASCRRDAHWFNDYYSVVFPSGRAKARENYERSKTFLRHNPYIGHVSDEPGLREFGIGRTPFAFIYRIKSDVIEVVRIWDQRSRKPDKWT